MMRIRINKPIGTYISFPPHEFPANEINADGVPSGSCDYNSLVSIDLKEVDQEAFDRPESPEAGKNHW